MFLFLEIWFLVKLITSTQNYVKLTSVITMDLMHFFGEPNRGFYLGLRSFSLNASDIYKRISNRVSDHINIEWRDFLWILCEYVENIQPIQFSILICFKVENVRKYIFVHTQKSKLDSEKNNFFFWRKICKFLGKIEIFWPIRIQLEQIYGIFWRNV